MLYRIRISHITTETADAKSFALEPLDGWQPVYKPGQFLTLVFDTRHGEKRRSYSISSIALLNEPLTITVKKVDNGEFSRWLLTKTAVGDILYTSGIYGLFTLPDGLDASRQLFFLAAGSGITPCLALIKQALVFTETPVVLIYSNRSQATTLFYNQLLQLSETFAGRFTIRFLQSDRLDVYHSRLSNWLLLQLLPRYLQVPTARALFYVCGPFDYMLMVNITLLGAGVPKPHIYREQFSSLPRPERPRPPDLSARKATIFYHGQTHEVKVKYPDAILQSARAQQVILPYSCEAGRCGSCVATCTSGKTWMAYNEVLTDDEVARGRVLTCQAYPVDGDVVIEF
jgi:ferredoxin-NADP reductase